MRSLHDLFEPSSEQSSEPWSEPSRYGFGILFIVALWLMALPAQAAEKIKVVATFSVLGDMVKEVGQERVQLITLVGADSDAHVFQPSPRDAGAVAKADLVVMNGLGFEGWIERLLESAHYKGQQVVASSGVKVLKSGEGAHNDKSRDKHAGYEEHHDSHDKHDAHKDHAEHKAHDHDSHKKHDDHEEHDNHKAHDEHKNHAKADHHGHDHGEWDPHAWHSIDNAIVYVRNIAAGLSKADPAHKADYQRNAKAYITKLEQLEHEIEHLFEDIPEAQRKVITPHDAFGYFANAYHIDFIAPQGNSTESEAAAGDVAQIIRQIRAENIKAVFVENIADSRLIEQISRETGASIGGALFSDALSDTNGPAGSYLDMMRHNANALAGALGHKNKH